MHRFAGVVRLHFLVWIISGTTCNTHDTQDSDCNMVLYFAQGLQLGQECIDRLERLVSREL